ncbi:MAG: hypothetical protein ACRYGK_10335 [Janthinobacterium lividum]
MKFLVISAHDYRSRRKAGIHFTTAELAKLGQTRFFSCRYSLLSKLKADPRISLDALSNRKTMFENVECYLWRTPIHPFNMNRPFLLPLENLLFRLYADYPSPVLVEWIKDSDAIFFESGIAPIFIKLVKKLNPAARTIYVASDDLATINVAQFVKSTFDQFAPSLSAICLKSKYMAPAMPASENRYVIPHGFDFSVGDHADPSPYGPGVHAVSVGSMLFDPDFFVSASRQFPEVRFHVIGSGAARHPAYGENVITYDEMPHRQTLPYIKHASFGIAPYRPENLPRYLADTSLKLMQYDFFKLPAVCPAAIVGDYGSRFGYQAGDEASIRAAISAAIGAPHVSSRTPLHWSQVVQRMLDPEAFDDTRLSAA